MHFNFRHLAHAGGLVVVEVALLDHSFAQGHLVAQRHRKGKTDRAFDLGGNHIRIDGYAAIHGGHDALDLDGFWRERNLGHHADPRAERLVIGEAPAATLSPWEGMVPAGLFSRKAYHG